jgi:uncharacterized protein YijF (DUF1287 family)
MKCAVVKNVTLVALTLLAAGPAMADIDTSQLVAAARSQIGVTVGYDPPTDGCHTPAAMCLSKPACVATWWFVPCGNRASTFSGCCTRI